MLMLKEMSRRKSTCEGCGCNCKNCSDSVGSLHLHVEIENLKQRLLERDNHIVSMETNFLRESEKFPNGEMAALTDELLTWQDKYSRLYESHKRVQKVNQNLEDKLLKIVDKCETEKNILTAEVAALTRRLVDEKFNVSKLQEENERYRNDVNLAIQLLQCKPSNFVPQKYDSLPIDLQQKVRSYVSSKRRMSVNDNQQKQPEVKTIKVPIPTFPPTAMVYSVNKPTNVTDKEGMTGNGYGEERNSKHGAVDIVSAAIMAKVLEERERERSQMKHCDTCTCPSGTNYSDSTKQQNKETQTNTDITVNHYINSNINNNLLFTESTVHNTVRVEHNKSVDSLKENYMSCNNNSSSGSSVISSPMNIRRSRSASSNINISSNSTGQISLAPGKIEKDSIQMDFFTEFNMSPTVKPEGKSEESLQISCSEKPSNHLSNDLNTGNQSDSTLSTDESDINSNHSCRVALENNRIFNSVNSSDRSSSSSRSSSSNSSSNSNNINNMSYSNDSKEIMDHICNNDSDNLIIFDKPVQLPSNSLCTSPALTVLGGNLNVNSSSSGKSGSIRHCSVRLQAGTSNILLDNVMDGPYAPVLYKSRPQPAFDPPKFISTSSSVSSLLNDDLSRFAASDSTVTACSNNINSSSSSSTYSNSSSSSTPLSSLSISSSSSLRKNNLMLAQLRTETEI